MVMARSREHENPDMLAIRAIPVPNPPARPPARDKMGLLAFPATVIQAQRDAEIVAQSASLSHCLQLMEGCVRIVCLLEDGRRHITEFLFPGDVFGLEMLP